MNKKQKKYLDNNINIIEWVVGLIIVSFVCFLYVLVSSLPNSILVIFGVGGMGLFVCLIFVMNEYESLGSEDEDI